MYKKFFRLDSGDKNFCRLYLPHKDAKNIPVIIYCHGWTKPILGGGRIIGGAPKQVRNAAIKNGMAFISFDQFGEYRTWGDNRYFTHERWGEGVNNVFEYIVESGLSRQGLIGCFGISSGTTAAFRMEQKYGKLAFIVSVATAISNNIINPGGPRQFYLDHKDILDNGGLVKYCNKKLSKLFFEDDDKNLCIEHMDKVKCPTYFLQGEKDNDRRKKDALDGYEILKSNGVPTEYMLVEGGGHGLNERAKLCAEKTIEFVKKAIDKKL
ncbi:MAG: hypothetical protein K2J89_06830 [Clostridia bacterium]|nr:hypothetical protein [Clostridia bacterium]